MQSHGMGFIPSLPTPAISGQSLSRGVAKRLKLRNNADGDSRGWLKTVLGLLMGAGRGKTGKVLRELGWTLVLLVVMFFVTGWLALWMIQGLPM
jgi:hypothetical protein